MYLCLVVGLCQAGTVFGASISSLRSSMLAITSALQSLQSFIQILTSNNLDFSVWGLHVRVVTDLYHLKLRRPVHNFGLFYLLITVIKSRICEFS